MRRLSRLLTFLFLSSAWIAAPGRILAQVAINNGTGPTGVTSNSATINATLTDNDGLPTIVRIYWGLSDGGTIALAWDNTVDFGVQPIGSVSTNLSGILSGTYYYYRCHAVNDNGEGWSPTTTNFFTGYAPVIANSTATNITAFSADLRGNLTSIGSAPASVYAFMGTNDGGTVASAWNTVLPFGVCSTGLTVTNVDNLTPGTLYYFRFMASNEYGRGWAPASATFTTPDTVAIVNSQGAAGVRPNSATLRGQVTGTAGEDPYVFVYFGLTDGDVTHENWSNVIAVGKTPLGAFAIDIQSLIISTTYYYRCWASNSLDTAWAPYSTNFNTGIFRYVDPANTLAAAAPYDTWSIAATSIQDAVDASLPGDLVWVTNGIYDTGSTLYSNVPYRLVVTNSVNVQSVNGPSSASLVGSGPAGPGAIRCAFLANGSSISGFTLTNGYSQTSGDTVYAQSGGGALLQSGAILHDCLVVDCYAESSGGGVYASGSATLTDTRILRCTAASGGGANLNAASASNCLVEACSATNDAGGILLSAGAILRAGTVTNCTAGARGGGALINTSGSIQGTTLVGNRATNSTARGGGICLNGGGQVAQAMVVANTSAMDGGGVYLLNGGSVRSTLIVRNAANVDGGGVKCFGGGIVESSTLVHNRADADRNASGTGGGMWVNVNTQLNCIVLYNTAFNAASSNIVLSGLAQIRYSCVAPTIISGIGPGCLAANPLFVNTNALNYRLDSSSVLRNFGNNQAWMIGQNDLDRNPRILEGTVDIGAYEFGPSPLVTNLCASGIDGLAATLNGRLISTGAAPSTVYLFWGPTDGGSTPASWASTANIGLRAPGGFSFRATNLVPNATTYYRCMASNVYGVAWAAEATNFFSATTTPPTLLHIQAPPFALTGALQTVTVTALHPDGSINTAYAGTIQFSSTDPAALLPTNYTFQPADAGIRSFSNEIQFATPGARSLSIHDTAQPEMAADAPCRVLAPGGANTLDLLVEVLPRTAVSNQWLDIMISAVDDGGLVNTSHTAQIEFLASDPAANIANPTWTTFDHGVAYISNQIQFLTPGLQTLRAQLSADATIDGTVTVPVVGGGTRYYVDWARGTDAASGATTGTAWRTLAHALRIASTGDVVFVRPGVYKESALIRSGGTTARRVALLADTLGREFGTISRASILAPPEQPGFLLYGVTAIDLDGFSISGNLTQTGLLVTASSDINIRHINIDSACAGFVVNDSPAVTLESVSVTGATAIGFVAANSHGLQIQAATAANCAMGGSLSGSTGIAVRASAFTANTGIGLRLYAGTSGTITNSTATLNLGAGLIVQDTNTRVQVVNCLAADNVGNGLAFLSAATTGCAAVNNTLSYNTNGLVVTATPGLDIRNNIIAFNVATGLLCDAASTNNRTGGYNCLYSNKVNRSTAATAMTGDLASDPLFADTTNPGNRDLHLQSTRGRYTSAGWAIDALHSPCIDTADPADSYAYETLPDGWRRNMGAYGNTPQASRGIPPPPEITNDGGASNLTQTTAQLNGFLSSTGKSASVAWVYWGTSDGGSNYAAWARSASFGQVPAGIYSTNLTGLFAGKQYFYRFMASNVFGTVWTYPSVVFTTDFPHVQFATPAMAGQEAVTTTNFILALSAVANHPVSVNYSVSGGTATSGLDFTPLNGTATIPAGSLAATVSVFIVDDAIGEDDETIQLTLASPIGAIIGTNSTLVYTINDNDAPGIRVSANNLNVAENGATANYLISLRSEPVSAVTVQVSIAGSDIARTPASLVFDAGNWTVDRLITVWAVDDYLDENTETNILSHIVASGDTNYNGIASSNVIVRIADDDTAGISISATSFALSENGPVTTNYTIVLLSQPTDVVTVSVSTATAQLAPDLDTLEFQPAQWNVPQTVTLTVNDDPLYETKPHFATVTNSFASPDPAYDLIITNIPVTIADDDYLLSVSSVYGSPNPPLGISTNEYASNIACFNDPFVIDGGTQYVGKGWTGTGSVPASGTGMSVNVAIATDSSINWLWRTNYWLETSGATPSGSVSVSSGWMPIGTNISVLAAPATTYQFVGWAGSITTNINPVTVSMTSARELIALFKPITNYLAIASPYGSPNPPRGTNWFTVTAAVSASVPSPVPFGPTTQRVCVGWSGSGSVPLSGIGSAITVALSTDSSLTWNWTNEYYLGIGPVLNGSLDANAAWHRDGTNVIITATPSTTYQFIGWAGTLPTNSNPLTISMTRSHFITPIFMPITNSIEVTSPFGSPSPPVGTNWYTVDAHLNVSVPTPVPVGTTTQRVNLGWTGSGDIPASGSSNSFRIVFSNASSITWLWTNDFYLAVPSNQTGRVSPAAGWYRQLTNLTVTAIPATSYHFVAWSGDIETNANPIDLTLDRAYNLTPLFMPTTNYLEVLSTHSNTTPLPGTNWYTIGARFTASVPPVIPYGLTTQYVCIGWSGTGDVPVAGTTNFVNLTISNNSTLAWNWTNEYYISVTPHAKGTVNLQNGWHRENTNLVITATPTNTYRFAGWIGDLVTNANPLILPVDRAYRLQPIFVLHTNALEVQSDYGPTIPPVGTNWYTISTIVNALAPSPVFAAVGTQRVCVGWSGTGNVPASGQVNYVSMRLSNDSLIVWHWTNEYYISITPDPNGTVDLPDEWYRQSTNLTLTATPATSYHFVAWSGDIQTNTNPLDLTVEQAYNIIPIFMPITNYLAVSSLFGAPSPGTGTNWLTIGATFHASVDSPVLTSIGTQRVCIGWAADGDVLPSGETNGVGIILSNNSTLAWIWTNEFYLGVADNTNGSVNFQNAWCREGTNFDLTATPRPTYKFVGWSGDILSTNNPLRVDMDKAYNLVPNYILLTNYVAVSSPYGAPSPAIGTNWVTIGDLVNVWVPSPVLYGEATQRVCIGWNGSGDVPTAGISTSVYVVVSNDSSVSWNWTNAYSLVVDTPTNGFVNTAGGWFKHGESVIIFAVPATTYQFIGWAGHITGNANPLMINMDRAYHITPIFANLTNALYVTSAHGAPNPPVGINTLVIGHTLNASVESPVPNGNTTQFVCTGWAGTGDVPASGTTNFVSAIISNTSTLAWKWTNEYYVTVQSAPNGTYEFTDGWYTHNTNVLVTAFASNTFQFDSWSGDIQTNANPLLLNVTRTLSFHPNFVVKHFTLQADAGTNGTITPSGPVQTPRTTATNFVIAAAPHHHISSVWVDGVDVGPTNSYTFENVLTNHTIQAFFTIDDHSLTVASEQGAPVPPSGTNIYNYGTWLDISNMPISTIGSTQYICTGWTGSGSIPSSGSVSYLSTTLTVNSAISWLWHTNYWLDIAPYANGTVSTPSRWLDAGTTIVVTATPATNYFFAGWNLAGVPDSRSITLTATRAYALTPVFMQVTNSLTVITPYGQPTPPLGVSWHHRGTRVYAGITGTPAFLGTTQMVASGYFGTGDVPGWGYRTNVSFILSQNSSITWIWAPKFYLNLSSLGSGTVSSVNGWYDEGALVNLSATPQTYARFVQWNGDVPPGQNTVNPLTVNMDQARNITAIFARDTTALTLTLHPQPAAAPARWRVTPGPNTNWLASGSTLLDLPLAAGPYTIEFTTLPGWTPPPATPLAQFQTDQSVTLHARYLPGILQPVPGGTFAMGMVNSTGGVLTTLSSFLLDQHEVTVAEYQAFLSETAGSVKMPNPPAWGWTNTNLPIVSLTWNEAAAYAAWAGKRLPTEAEFEYAMRGGSRSILYPWGNTVAISNANYGGSVGRPTQPGTYPATTFSLSDIGGNVWEWCADWTDLLTGPVTNPAGPLTGYTKSITGGSWTSNTNKLACTARFSLPPSSRYTDMGFRCARNTLADLVSTSAPAITPVPVWWSTLYYSGIPGVSLSFQPEADSDNDGESNFREFLAGTNPTNSLSIFHVQAIDARPSSGIFILTWPAIAGRYYTLEMSESLASGFTPIATGIPGAILSSYTTTLGTARSTYYRIKTQP